MFLIFNNVLVLSVFGISQCGQSFWDKMELFLLIIGWFFRTDYSQIAIDLFQSSFKGHSIHRRI
ncbi:hypothetical protein RND81_10G198700 [Saponaria officinalis]|uniref:Uncharacterized protein n=1 Tax=Saponaria officinalis TaxID=3572 RepID=A0AAW1I6T6_SAPOF